MLYTVQTGKYPYSIEHKELPKKTHLFFNIPILTRTVNIVAGINLVRKKFSVNTRAMMRYALALLFIVQYIFILCIPNQTRPNILYLLTYPRYTVL